MRELVSGHSIEKVMVDNFWTDFLDLLKCDYIKEFHFDESIVEIAGSLKLKLRTLVNFFHLFIAKSIDIYFVTGDKDMIIKIRKNNIYDKVLSYIELRKIITSSSPNS